MTEKKTGAQPFVKWAGGKRKVLPSILRHLPKKIGHYFEPFVGGGAVYFALANKKAFEAATVNDLNDELITTYKLIASDRVHDIVALLGTYQHAREFYHHLRQIPGQGIKSDVVKAARFLYLNKTCFNGLYRVNRKGEFNVPFGAYKNPTICDEAALLRAHDALQGTTFLSQDFVKATEAATLGDFVYFDPPYLPISSTSSFTAYTAGGFSWKDHERLAAHCRELVGRGVHVVVSNSDNPGILELYEEGFDIHRVQAPRSINSKGDRRGLINELVIVSP
jgi:DNA adenine methylase